MPGRARVPVTVRRCVRAVAADKGVPLDRAFAICVAQGQKSGALKPGSLSATKRGKAAGRSKSREAGAAEKTAEYEKLLAGARQERVRLSLRTLVAECRRLLGANRE